MRDQLTAWAQQLRHARALGKVLARFDEARIPAIPVKGIVSAHTLYDDIAERLLTDVDLRIVPGDFDRVLALVRQERWPVIQLVRSYANLVFVVDGVCIDVRGYPSVPGLSRLTVATMLERAKPSTVLGFPHWLPSFEDHAVILMLNVFKDKLVYAFGWAVRDLERLPSHRDFDAEKLVRVLREVGAATIGWVVADWMLRDRKVAGWQAIRDGIGRHPPRAAFVALLGLSRASRRGDTLPFRVLARAAADGRADQARALLHMAWFQAEVWFSQWGDIPFHRNDPTRLKGTIADESRK
jgi:hypothetical protein